MKKRNVFASVLLLTLAFVAFLVRRWNEPERKEAFDRHPSSLVYSKQALCLMACRQISREEIKEIMQKGVINFNRSDRQGRPCPIFALQGRTTGGESLRVFFAQCSSQTKVISCYHLKKESECHCPGSE